MNTSPKIFVLNYCSNMPDYRVNGYKDKLFQRCYFGGCTDILGKHSISSVSSILRWAQTKFGTINVCVCGAIENEVELKGRLLKYGCMFEDQTRAPQIVATVFSRGVDIETGIFSVARDAFGPFAAFFLIDENIHIAMSDAQDSLKLFFGFGEGAVIVTSVREDIETLGFNLVRPDDPALLPGEILILHEGKFKFSNRFVRIKPQRPVMAVG